MRTLTLRHIILFLFKSIIIMNAYNIYCNIKYTSSHNWAPFNSLITLEIKCTNSFQFWCIRSWILVSNDLWCKCTTSVFIFYYQYIEMNLFIRRMHVFDWLNLCLQKNIHFHGSFFIPSSSRSKNGNPHINSLYSCFFFIVNAQAIVFLQLTIAV